MCAVNGQTMQSLIRGSFLKTFADLVRIRTFVRLMNANTSWLDDPKLLA